MVWLKCIGGDEGTGPEQDKASDEQHPPWGKSFHGIHQGNKQEFLDLPAASLGASG
jgi:hypothetical protein